MEIHVVHYTGPDAVFDSTGQELYEDIVKYIEEGVELSFVHIELCTTNFLNVCIGQLYGQYTPDYIRDHLKVTNCNKDVLQYLKTVVENSKRYFQ